MSTHPNLADPGYEPSDEELAELMRRAFADVVVRRDRSLAEIRERIALGQREARVRLAVMLAKPR